MIGRRPLCESCTRLKREGDGYTCEAFPDGIPQDIVMGGFDHRNAHEGDNGVRFEQDPGKQKVDDAYFEAPGAEPQEDDEDADAEDGGE